MIAQKGNMMRCIITLTYPHGNLHTATRCATLGTCQISPKSPQPGPSIILIDPVPIFCTKRAKIDLEAISFLYESRPKLVSDWFQRPYRNCLVDWSRTQIRTESVHDPCSWSLVAPPAVCRTWYPYPSPSRDFSQILFVKPLHCGQSNSILLLLVKRYI